MLVMALRSLLLHCETLANENKPFYFDANCPETTNNCTMLSRTGRKLESESQFISQRILER